MSVDSIQSGGRKSEGFVRRFIWNAKNRNGLVIALPSVIGFVGAQAIGVAIDRDLLPLKARISTIQSSIAVLDNTTRNYETYELLRASFRVDIAASGGDQDLALRLDQLYRQSSLKLLRLIAKTLDATAWDARLDDYRTTVMTDYRADGGAGAARLQGTENALIEAAKARLTADQQALNDEKAQSDALEARKEWWQNVLTYLGNIASVLAFFAKNKSSD